MKKLTLFFILMFLSFTSFAQLPEGFEGTSVPDLTSDDWVLPSGTWKVYDNGIGLAQNWATIPAPNACTGTRSAYLNRENVASGLAEDWLVMPLYTVPNNGQLRFITKQTQAGNQGSVYSIRISTTSQTDQTTFTTLQTWTETELNAVFNICEEKVVQFPTANYNQGVYVAFVMSNDNGDRWIVDDVNIVEQCLDPTTQTATNATLSSSDLGWDNPSGASSWEVEVVATAAAPTGSGIVTGNNPYTATGLTPGTCYDFYVRALCTSGTNSEWIGPFNFCTVSLGETCGASIAVPSLPYTTTDNTSGYGDDYAGSPGATGCGTTGTYLNGDDVFYSFTATTANSVTITSQTNSTWSGIFVYNSCANIGVSCVAGSTAGNGNTTADSVTFTPTIGQTYYIVISTWATPQSVPYTLTIIENTCTNMAATFAVVSNCTSVTDPDTFFVTANVTNIGSATSISGTSTPASPTAVPAITAAGIMQFGPFANGTNVTVNLQNEQDANCFKNSTALTQGFCPATNNLCDGSIPVTCGSTITQTTVGATATGAPTGTCGTTGGSGGLWYSFAGTGDVVTFSLCGSSFDTKIQVVTGSCGAFTCVTGNDDSCGLQSEVQVVTVPGTLYYIYVYGYGSAQGVFTLNTTCVTPPPPPVNDNCDTATNVTVNVDGSCTLLSPGTVAGATATAQANACLGTADDDVWFTFTATQATHTITIQDIAGSTLDLNHAVYTSASATDPCGSLTQIVCSNPNFSVPGGLVAGEVYYIRVYSATAVPLQTTTFNVCVSVPPPPPSNDSCATPLIAPVNSSIICALTIPGTISSATASPEPNTCGGTDDDDVWFQFTATANTHNINLTNIIGTTTDLAFATYSGADCSSLTQINCQLNNSGIVGGLTIGESYYIRVYSQPATTGLFADFELCITTPVQCDSAQPACGDAQVYVNQTGLASYGTIGCLFTTPNPFWFQFEIETTGPITFTLSQSSPGGNSDVDFILWGPFTTAEMNTTACNNLFDYPDGNTTIPNNIIDCSYSAAATEFVDIPNAIAGEHYLLLVTNYGNSQGTFTLPQTSGTGAASCCSVVLGDDIILCDETSYTINATISSQDSVSWFKDSVLIPGQITDQLIVTETGVYKCEITCGQITKSDEISVTFSNSPQFTITPDFNICENATGTILITPIDFIDSDVTYSWTLDSAPLPDTTGSISVTQGGTYTVVVDRNGCSTSMSTVVTITTSPVSDVLSDQVLCDSSPYVLPVLSLGNSYYTGSNATGSMLNAGDAISSTQMLYVYAQSGTTPNCTDESSFTVTIVATPVVATPSDVSSCDSYVLPVLSSGNSYYTGSNATGSMLNAGDVISSTQMLYVYAQSGSSPNCTAESSFTITIVATPVSDVLSDQVRCAFDFYTLPVLSSGNSYYTGSNATGSMLNAGDAISSTQMLYVYAQSGSSPNCTDESSFMVTYVDLPVVSLTGECTNNDYTITATINSTESVTYQWSNSSGVIPGASGATLVVTQDGNYSCTVSLSSSLGCSSEVEVFAADGTLCTIQKGISPNNDGLNDHFNLIGLNVKQLSIYNRYGLKVYNYANYTNQWHGQTNKGDELPTGTYYFVIERDNVEAKSGWIYINRDK